MTDFGLFGSSILPPTIMVGTRQVQLGDVVRRAFEDARQLEGVTVEEWNGLDPFNRDVLIVAAVHDLREEVEAGVPC